MVFYIQNSQSNTAARLSSGESGYYYSNWVGRGTGGDSSTVNMALIAKVTALASGIQVEFGVRLDTGSISAPSSVLKINNNDWETCYVGISNNEKGMIADHNYANDKIRVGGSSGEGIIKTFDFTNTKTQSFTFQYKRSSNGTETASIALNITEYTVGAPTNIALTNIGNNTYRITATSGENGEGVHCYYTYMDNIHTVYDGVNENPSKHDGMAAANNLIPIYKGISKIMVKCATIPRISSIYGVEIPATWGGVQEFNVNFNNTTPTISLTQPEKTKNISIAYNDQNRNDINEINLLVLNTTKGSIIFQSNSVASSYSAVISPSDSDGLENSKNKDNIRGSIDYTYKEYSYDSNEKKLIPEIKANTISSDLTYQASPIYVRTQNGFENGTAYVLKNGQWVESSDVIVKI